VLNFQPLCHIYNTLKLRICIYFVKYIGGVYIFGVTVRGILVPLVIFLLFTSSLTQPSFNNYKLALQWASGSYMAKEFAQLE